MITIDAYKLAKEKVEQFDAEQEELRKKQNKECNGLRDKYWELERNLRNKKNEEEQKLVSKHQRENDKLSSKRKDYDYILGQFSRIMKFMEIHKEEKSTDFLIYRYQRFPGDDETKKIPYKPFDTIKDDKYAKIQVFITENHKPKNKYTLAIAGRTIFTDEQLFTNRLPYTYGLDCNHDFTTILKRLADRPTEEELKAYYNRNKDKHLDFLKEILELETEYEEVVENTNNQVWEKLYWENQKEYYERHVSHGTEMKEYQMILEELAKLER